MLDMIQIQSVFLKEFNDKTTCDLTSGVYTDFEKKSEFAYMILF